MGTIRKIYKILILINLTLGNPALADDVTPPLTFIGQYGFSWNGIPFGSLTLGIEETATHYSLRLHVASSGIINLFTSHVSDTVATGKRVGSTYRPALYESHYKTKNKPRHIRLAFNAKGAVTEEIVEPPEDRNERPEVPHSLKDGAYDPLTLLLALRMGAPQYLGFDAKRLYEVVAKPVDTPHPAIFGKYTVIPYALSRTPLGGLTAQEMQKYRNGEPPLLFYFSADPRHIPIGIKVPFMLSSIRGILTRECTTWEACER